MKSVSTKRLPGSASRDRPRAPSRRPRIAGVVAGLFWVVAAHAGFAWAGSQPVPAPPQQQEQGELSEAESLERRADIYMARKYYPEAIAVYEKLLALQPGAAVLHNKMGIAYHQLQDFGAAKKEYRKALQLDPQYAQAVNNLAAVEYAQKHHRGAILTYLKALELSPGDAVIYSNLGTAYFAYKRFQYAMDCYRYALMLDPEIFLRSGRSGSIVHQRDQTNSAAFNFFMAKAYAAIGNAEETLQHLRKAWEEGFPDLRKALEDEVFAFLAEEPGFQEFLSLLEPEPNRAQN